MKKKAGIIIFMVIFFLYIGIVGRMDMEAEAAGPGYGDIGETVDPEVVELTEAVAEVYPVCPELLQAVVFYESSNQRAAVSRYGDIGYMQVNPRWQRARMDKLGIKDLMDGYSNILVGADYLCELFEKYEEPVFVLMCYNEGPGEAERMYDGGWIRLNILHLSEQLERLHGK